MLLGVPAETNYVVTEFDRNQKFSMLESNKRKRIVTNQQDPGTSEDLRDVGRMTSETEQAAMNYVEDDDDDEDDEILLQLLVIVVQITELGLQFSR